VGVIAVAAVISVVTPIIFAFRFGIALNALNTRRVIVTGGAVITTAAAVINAVTVIIFASRRGLDILALYTPEVGKGLVTAAIAI
jgi:hypothetical protein